jgi:tetratricopeptide (TPR) repeat protein
MRRIFSPVRAALFVAACAPFAAGQAPVSSPDEARAVAVQLAQAGNTPAAILLLQEELAKHPADTATRLQLARQLALSKRYAEANENYSAVLAREPQNLAAQVGLAKVASWQGDLDRGLALYDDVLTRSPHLYDARVGKGFTLAWMGRHDEALAILRAAAKVHPEDQEVAAEVARLAKLVRNADPVPLATAPMSRRNSPSHSAPATAWASAPIPTSATANYPRTFAEPIAPAVALAPEPRPWIPLSAFAGVVLALAGVTFAVRKRIHVSAATTFADVAEAPSQPVCQAESVAAAQAPRAPTPRLPRALLLETNDDAAEFVSMVLTEHGAQVERCFTLHDVLTHSAPFELIIIGEACGAARAEELIGIAERAGTLLVFACNSSEEAQAIHAAGGQSIRRPFRIMDLIALLAPVSMGEPPIDAHTWRPAQAEAASCARPFHSPPRPLQ